LSGQISLDQTARKADLNMPAISWRKRMGEAAGLTMPVRRDQGMAIMSLLAMARLVAQGDRPLVAPMDQQGRTAGLRFGTNLFQVVPMFYAFILPDIPVF
jgi:hypothetical protein